MAFQAGGRSGCGSSLEVRKLALRIRDGEWEQAWPGSTRQEGAVLSRIPVAVLSWRSPPPGSSLGMFPCLHLPPIKPSMLYNVLKVLIE